MSDATDEDFGGLPPSAKLVYKTLVYADESLTQQELARKSRLSARTVRYGLERLDRIDAIEKRINFADARQRLYTPVREAVSRSPEIER